MRWLSSGAGPPNWSSAWPVPVHAGGQVLQLAAAAVVADHDVELAVGAEPDLAAVVVAPQGLGSTGSSVLLERVELDEVPVERQRLGLRVHR